MTIAERHRKEHFRLKLEAVEYGMNPPTLKEKPMNLVTVHVKPPIPSREFDWAAYDSDADICYDVECSCRKNYVQGTGASELAAIISFVRGLLDKHDIDLEFAFKCDASEKEWNALMKPEEPCEKS